MISRQAADGTVVLDLSNRRCRIYPFPHALSQPSTTCNQAFALLYRVLPASDDARACILVQEPASLAPRVGTRSLVGPWSSGPAVSEHSAAAAWTSAAWRTWPGRCARMVSRPSGWTTAGWATTTWSPSTRYSNTRAHALDKPAHPQAHGQQECTRNCGWNASMTAQPPLQAPLAPWHV